MDPSGEAGAKMRETLIGTWKFEVPEVKYGDLVEWAATTKVSRPEI
jgi:hypothetical protein